MYKQKVKENLTKERLLPCTVRQSEPLAMIFEYAAQDTISYDEECVECQEYGNVVVDMDNNALRVKEQATYASPSDDFDLIIEASQP